MPLRVVDVGSEWRTFANDSESKDMSRVGAIEVCVDNYRQLYLVYLYNGLLII